MIELVPVTQKDLGLQEEWVVVEEKQVEIFYGPPAVVLLEKDGERHKGYVNTAQEKDLVSILSETQGLCEHCPREGSSKYTVRDTRAM